MLPDPQRQASPLPAHYSISARELVTVCWRRKWYFILCIAVASSLGAAYFVRADRLYQVTARVLVEKQGLPLGGAPEQQEKEFLATQAEILGSPAVVADAVAGLQWPAPLAEGVSPTKKLIAGLDVRPVMGTQVISVSYRSHHAVHAREAVERVIESYRHYLQEAEQDTYLETLRLLTQNEKDLRADLQDLQREYRDLRKSSPVTGSGKNGSDVQILLVQQLGQKLNETRNRRIELEHQLASAWQHAAPKGNTFTATAAGSREGGLEDSRVERAVAHVGEDGSPVQPAAAIRQLSRASLLSQFTLPEGTDIGNLQSQLSAARLRETELAERYGHKHSDLRAARQQIAELEQSLEEVIDAAPAILQQQLAAVEASEERIAELYRAEVAKAKEIDAYLLEEKQALDHIERVQMLHDSVLTQLRESELTSQALADGRSGVKVSVLEAPEPPSSPLWPSAVVLAVVSAAVGLACSVGLIVFAEYRNPTFPVQAAAVASPATPLPDPPEETEPRQGPGQLAGQVN